MTPADPHATTVTIGGAAAGERPAVDLSTTLAGIALPHPVFTASGCSAAGRELDPYLDLTAIGGVTTKSIFPHPRSGRPTPRMAETPSGMLNSIGLQGPGVDAFVAHDLRWLADRGVRTIVSIAGSSVEDYLISARRLAAAAEADPAIGAALVALEVNISCPNVEDRGLVFACDPGAAGRVLTAVREAVPDRIPVLAKLSPDVTDIVVIARACTEAGASGLSMVNTLLGVAIDRGTLRPVLGGVTGGLSGPAIRPVAVRCVWQVHQALPQVPILAMGGIRTGFDALEFLAAGAAAVAVGTVVFNDPGAPARIGRELAAELHGRGIARLADVVGAAHRAPRLGQPAHPDPPGDDRHRDDEHRDDEHRDDEESFG